FLAVGSLTSYVIALMAGDAASMRAVMFVGVGFVGVSALALRQVDARRRDLDERVLAEPTEPAEPVPA
ncbi:MAG TPA: hypothetical protein VIC63_07075, partial [Candidatus Limnocylindria bacterium]